MLNFRSRVLVLVWSVSLIGSIIAETTPMLSFTVKSPVEANVLIGSIKSNNMEAPYYIVPIKPEDPDVFNRDLRIDLETGK